MGTPDYIPKAHDAFFVWQGNFYSRANEKLSSFKIDPEKFKPVTAAKSKYEQAFNRASNPEGANSSDRVERDERETEYKTVIRQFVNENIRFNSNVSDYDRTYLGLTVADGSQTPAPVPATHPVLKIDISQPQQHTILIQDEASSSKAKPAGVMQCEIWFKVSQEVPTEDEMAYAGSSSKATFVVKYKDTQSGLRAYYKARWVNTRGEQGPWGAMVSAVIG